MRSVEMNCAGSSSVSFRNVSCEGARSGEPAVPVNDVFGNSDSESSELRNTAPASMGVEVIAGFSGGSSSVDVDRRADVPGDAEQSGGAREIGRSKEDIGED